MLMSADGQGLTVASIGLYDVLRQNTLDAVILMSRAMSWDSSDVVLREDSIKCLQVSIYLLVCSS